MADLDPDLELEDFWQDVRPPRLPPAAPEPALETPEPGYLWIAPIQSDETFEGYVPPRVKVLAQEVFGAGVTATFEHTGHAMTVVGIAIYDHPIAGKLLWEHMVDAPVVIGPGTTLNMQVSVRSDAVAPESPVMDAIRERLQHFGWGVIPSR